MRQVFAIAFLCTSLFADSRTQQNPVTLVLKFEGPQSPAAVAAMKQEVAELLKHTAARVDFRLPDELGGFDEPGNLIVVKFRGNCRMSNALPLYDERGPLAFTHTAGGQVLPFSEVECDRVTRSVQSAMWGGDHARADELLGRALGRVVAHELYHILGNTHAHAATGVARKALTGEQLIQTHQSYDSEEIRIRKP